VSEGPESARLFCIECGTPATSGAQFCMACGSRLHREHLEAAPAPSTTLQAAPTSPPPPAKAPEPRPGGSPWKPIAAVLGLVLGAWLGGETGQVLSYAGARASARTSAGATPEVAALASSREGVRPGRMLGGLAGFMVTVLCLVRPGRIRWFSFAIGGLSGGAAGALAGWVTGYL